MQCTAIVPKIDTMLALSPPVASSPSTIQADEQAASPIDAPLLPGKNELPQLNAPSPDTALTKKNEDPKKNIVVLSPSDAIPKGGSPQELAAIVGEVNKNLKLLIETTQKTQQQAEIRNDRRTNRIISYGQTFLSFLGSVVKWTAASTIPTYCIQLHRDAHLYAKTALKTIANTDKVYKDYYWDSVRQTLKTDGLTTDMLPNIGSYFSNLSPYRIVQNKMLGSISNGFSSIASTLTKYPASLLSAPYNTVINPILSLDTTSKVIVVAIVTLSVLTIVARRQKKAPLLPV